MLTGTLLSRMFASRQARESWDSLNGAKLNSLAAVAGAEVTELVEATRTPGQPFKPLSAKTLKPLHFFAKWIVAQGGLNALADLPTEQLRDDLLMIPGISPAAADAVLLYGLYRPVFPVDRPTYRIMARHGWIDPTTDYEEARARSKSQPTAMPRCSPASPTGSIALASFIAVRPAQVRRLSSSAVPPCKRAD